MSVQDGVSQIRMRGGNDLQSLYGDMIDSESYQDYKIILDQFVDDLNFDGDPAMLVDEDDIIDWVSNNLSKTSFATLQDAEDASSNLITKYQAVVDENILFFEELQLSDPSDFFEIIGEVYVPASGPECDEECRKNFLGCTNTAATSHANAMHNAYSGVNWNNPTEAANATKKADNALKIYTIAMGICGETHQSCLLGCVED